LKRERRATKSIARRSQNLKIRRAFPPFYLLSSPVNSAILKNSIRESPFFSSVLADSKRVF